MNTEHAEAAARMARAIEADRHDRRAFRDALLGVPPAQRDAWLDRVLGLGAVPEDGPELPRGCTPYLPCPVDALVRIADHAAVSPSDVFVDVGSGVGRAAALMHLLTGAGVIGIEIQPHLITSARELVARLATTRVANVAGDAAQLVGYMMTGSVFFLYCPFSGARLDKVLDDLEPIAQTRPIRVCCVDLPLPPRAWLAPALDVPPSPDVAIYRSTLH
jgi:SAM-dependent methyltransferase